ncbi:MAG: T9SS type A sorting domain-containing protein [Bacteroidia bacterium]
MKQIVLIVFLFVSFLLKAQPPSKFYSTYGGNGYDVGYSVKQTLDGGYIIAGSTSSFGQGNTDFYLLKLDSLGQKKFETSFGGYSNEIAKSVIQLSDSSFVIAGYTSSFGIGGYDIFVVKADKNGNLIWQKTFGGNDWDFAYNIELTSDGGFIICGTTYSFGYGNADGYIIKTDGAGNVTWTKTFGGKHDDEFKSVIQTSDGNYALTGYTKSFNDSLGDAWIFKIDLNGDSIWSYSYGGNKEDFGNQVIEKGTDYFIVGATASVGAGMLDACAYKINSLGGLINMIYDGTSSNDEIYNSITVSKRNSVDYLCFIEREYFPGFKLQTKVIEYDNYLNYKNATDYGSSSIDETYQIVSTKDKGYAIVGYTQGYNAVLTDLYFVKIDSTLNGGNYSIVSVDELQDESILANIFPNPSSGEINIKSIKKIDIKDIHLFDLLGNEILTKEKFLIQDNNTIKLILNELESGLYYLKLFDFSQQISIIH